MHEKWWRASIKVPYGLFEKYFTFLQWKSSSNLHILLHWTTFSMRPRIWFTIFIYIPAVTLHTVVYVFFSDVIFFSGCILELYAWLYILVCLFQRPSSSQYTSHFICAGISQKLSSRNTQTEKLLSILSVCPVSRWSIRSSSESQLLRRESVSKVIFFCLTFFPRTQCCILSVQSVTKDTQTVNRRE